MAVGLHPIQKSSEEYKKVFNPALRWQISQHIKSVFTTAKGLQSRLTSRVVGIHHVVELRCFDESANVHNPIFSLHSDSPIALAAYPRDLLMSTFSEELMVIVTNVE